MRTPRPALGTPGGFYLTDGAVEALVTLLAVVVFGLGWATLEVETEPWDQGARGATGYADMERTGWTLAMADFEASDPGGWTDATSARGRGDFRGPDFSEKETKRWVEPAPERSKR